MNANIACPICGQTETHTFLRRNHHPFSIFMLENGKIPEIDLRLNYCDGCTAVFTASAFADEAYRRCYSRNYETYTLLDETLRPFPSRDDYYVKALEFLKRVHQFEQTSNVLEVGSNRGDFLFLLKEVHPELNVLGVEPSRLDFHGVPTVNRYLDAGLFGNSFDLIVARHVLEHIVDPLQFLRQIHKSLSENGTLFLEVPNFWIDILQQRETFIPEHVHYFTAKSLVCLIEGAGLHVTCCDDQHENGIYVIAHKSVNTAEKEVPSEIDSTDLDTLLDAYAAAMNATVKRAETLLIEGYTIAFYGFGNIFLSAFAHLGMFIDHQRHSAQYVILDDTPAKIGLTYKNIPICDFSHLTRNAGEKTAVMICTMNRQHHLQMKKRLKDAGVDDRVILSPWTLDAN